MPKRSLSDLVLDTIDTISARKNRPNLVRIFRHLHRLYDLSFPTCESLLQSLLKEGKVIRVTYKGNISYRNALKWKKYSYYMKKSMGSELPGSLLTNAISELVVQEPDYLSMGVPCDILEQHLLSMQNDNINKEAIHKLLQRELKLQSLLQLDNGNYFLGPKPVESTLYDTSDPDIKLKVPKYSSSESCETIITRIQNCFDSDDVWTEENNKQSKMDKSSNRESSVLEETISDENELLEAADSELLDDMPSKTDKNEDGSNTLNGIITKFASYKLTEETLKSEENRQDVCSSNAGEKKPLHVTGSSEVSAVEASNIPSLPCNDNAATLETVVKLENDFELEGDTVNEEVNDHYGIHSIQDVNKIIGVESKDLCETDESSSPLAPSKLKILSPILNSQINTQKEEDDEEEEEKDVKTVIPVLERVRRKKKTKYDASDYYFPSLKRKTRDSSDSDRKEEKRKKKKKKKDLRPSHISATIAKRRVMFPGNSSMCSECNCYVSKVRFDPMIFCSTCSNQGHQSCAIKFMSGKNWFCGDCRQDVETCQICKKMPHTKDRGELYACSCCGSLFHQECHNPSIHLPFSTRWHCFSCPPLSPQDKEVPRDKTENCVDKTNSDSDSTSENESKGVKCKSETEENGFFKEEPPDPTNWTSEDVYNYFRKYFDEDVAKVILDQDIDGYSLKLLGRADVLKLDFKLGICLKILLHIKRLQLHSNNLVEIWNN